MTGVVLRCPNCGTTQAVAGECEACHEADVRHFCPNHTPGRWLVGTACPDCGARVGRAPAGPASPPRRPPAATRPPASIERPPRMPRPRDPAGDAWGAPPEPVRRGDYDDAIEVGRVEPPIGWPGARPPTIHLRPLPILGCVGRLVMWVVTAIILLAMATCWFFGGGGIVIGAAPQRSDAPLATVVSRPPATPLVPARATA